jgi:hypothetical protein
MKNLLKLGTTACVLAAQYCTAAYRGVQERHVFQDVETYCMFIGYPKSGHSLIGSLLDAHPDIVIAHELDALKYLHARFTKRQLYSLLLANSRRFAVTGRHGRHYSYAVPGQWQGKFRHIRIIGDKKGEGSTLRLRANPELLRRLRNVVGVPVKIIHVVRNPYDNISTIATRRRLSLQDAIAHYFALCDTVATTKTQIPNTDLFEIRHEAFVANPHGLLQELCRFLGMEATDDYLEACAGIVFQAPRQTRTGAQWYYELIRLVQDNIARFPFLQGYRYEN